MTAGTANSARGMPNVIATRSIANDPPVGDGAAEQRRGDERRELDRAKQPA